MPDTTRKLLMVELTWNQGLRSEAKMRDHIVTIDSSRDEGGDDLGPAPAEKMRIDLKNVRMEISGVKEHNEHPSSFTELHVNIALDTSTSDHAKLEKLVRLAEEDCTVSNTLRNAVAPTIHMVRG
jgi:hypothetical protein